MRSAEAQVISEAPGRVVVELRWQEPDHARVMQLFQVLRLRDGKILDMQDFEGRRAAAKAIASTT